MAAFDDAASAARVGVPSVVGIEGRAGYGKTTFLRAATAHLHDFQVLRAYGERNGQDERFQLLEAWGAGPAPRNAMQAMRQLTALLGTRQLVGPVALVVDDLHWVDRDSVDMLASLVERVAGDRLLVVAAYRPLDHRHAAWRRSTRVTIALDGLDVAAAADLVASFDPDPPPGLAGQLLAHTGGSPLHLRALLQERPVRELSALADRGELPAPADLAATLDARIGELAPEAGRLLHTLAVLGDVWTEAPTAAVVGGIADVTAAMQVLVDEDLVRVDPVPLVPRIRIGHAVVRAAVYQTMPAATRRGIHGAAAARLPQVGEQLRHRFAAALGPDEGLAVDLDRHADDRHAQSLYREASRFRRLAASVTAAPADREARVLEADLESLLANEPGEVSVTGLDEAAGSQRRLVRAIRLSGLKQWVAAARVLDDLDVGALDAVNTYRAHVLRAWTTFASGRPPAEALAPLGRADACPVKDHAFQALFLTTYGQVMHATGDQRRPLWGFTDTQDVERATLATSAEGLHRLSWRGSVSAVTGSTARAIGDLGLVTSRMDDGAAQLSDGILHAFLGFAQWCSGEWLRATISLDTALRATREVPHPTVLAIHPLTALVTGADPAASVVAGRDARLAGPIPAAIYTGDVSEVAILAFTGTEEQRREWRERRSADFGVPSPDAGGGRPPLVWLVAMGMAAAWAGDAEATDRWAETLAPRTGEAWCTNAVQWLRALAARTRGQPAPWADVARSGLPGLASFEALSWVDAAHQAGDPAVRDRAQAALTQLGAGRYVGHLLPEAPVTADPLAALSDREREVTTLLLEGLSYAQIARDLYVSRSTVAFHLSNVYAKTATTSRHELAQLCSPRAAGA